MWTVSYLPEALVELDAIEPAGEQVAIQQVATYLATNGISLPAPHCKSVQGIQGSWWELRPRQGHSPWRALYHRVGPLAFKIAAIGPDGETDKRGFAQACDLAIARLAAWKKTQEGK